MTRTNLPAGRPRRRPTPVRAAALLAATTAAALAGGPLAVPAAADTGAEPITDHHAVVLINFSDKSLSDVDGLHAKAVSGFFGTDSLTTYYADNSRGALKVVPAQGDGVFGPFSIDLTSSDCNVGQMADLARKALPADVSADDLSVVFPSTGACNWWGLGTVPGNTTWFQEGAVDNDDFTAALHEYGHNQGFNHEGREVCPVGQFTGCRGDGYSHVSPMGGGGEHFGLSAPELIYKKWLPANEVATPTRSGTIRLSALHSHGSKAGPRAIDIPLGTKGDRLVIEYRRPDPTTVDTMTVNKGETIYPGIDVFRVDQGGYQNAVLLRNSTEDKATVVGSFVQNKPMTDALDHISISYSNLTGEGADIKLNLAYHGTAQPGTTSHPTPAPTKGRPGDAASDLTHTQPPSVGHSTAAPTDPAQASDHSLAHTGANVAVPGLIGTALVGIGAVFMLRLRRTRRVRHGRH